MILGGVILLSSSELSAENVVFAFLGLLIISIIFMFQFRDNLVNSFEVEDSRSDNNG
jgi:hypothetical protein